MNIITDKIKNDKLLNTIKLFSPTTDILLVGGCIRDFYLGKENFDKDLIILNKDAKEFSTSLAKYLDATFIELDDENKIYRLVLRDKTTYLDITNPIENSLTKDLHRRDFTINAIAVNISSLEIFDLFDGLNDLQSKTIKLISEQNILDDPLRILRAFRFQANLNFSISNNSFELLKKHSKLINQPSKERITFELLKLFSGNNFYEAIEHMDKANVLCEIIPFMTAVKKVPPNSHHHLSLFYHSLSVSKVIQDLYEKSSLEIKSHLDKTDFGGFSRLTHLKLAGFLHDIGKFSTWTIEDSTGRHRFFKHEDVGAKMSIPYLKSMKFSKKQVEYISTMIKNHLYPSQVISMPEVSEKAYLKYIRKMNDNVIDNILLAQADRLSARGKAITDAIVEANISGLNHLLEFYLTIKPTLKPLPKLLSGEEIMAITGLNPCEELGVIIAELQEAQLNNDILTKEDAIEFIKKTIVH